ncbi:Zinc (Zn2)-Iron (Fe2) Permease (ZIP) Family [Achlya hypogyna]|uniref:Zinc (Zn2)-Iron (Fe2) Permease (ZIP) Family n=1 Tax=Achlya hypogyna TaxID=1202772 RepID=A0A1V9ZKI2_ACHHY|nr:Zinc (Zn2)-Iron (Fe2) Permease (ZIP) Family [Achlya hypogyna]
MDEIIVFNGAMCVVLLVLTVLFSLLPLFVSERGSSLNALIQQKLPYLTAGVFLATGMIHLLPDAVEHHTKYLAMVTPDGEKLPDFPTIYVLCCVGCMLIWAVDLINLGDSGQMMAVAAAAKPNYETSICKIHVPPIASYGIERRSRTYSASAIYSRSLSPRRFVSPLGTTHAGFTYGSCSCDNTILDKSALVKHTKQTTEVDVLLRANQSAVEIAEEPVGRCGADPHVHAHVEGSISEHIVFSGESAILPYLLAALFSLHSLIAGFTLGMNSELSRTAIATALAIISHKFIEAISVGANFAKAKDSVNSTRSIAVLVLYSFMTPLGIVLGMVLTSQLQGAPAQLAQAIALGVGSGSFIYLAFHEMSDEHAQEATSTLQKLALFSTGAAAMALLAIVT